MTRGSDLHGRHAPNDTFEFAGIASTHTAFPLPDSSSTPDPTGSSAEPGAGIALPAAASCAFRRLFGEHQGAGLLKKISRHSVA